MTVLPAPDGELLYGTPEPCSRLMISDLQVLLSVAQAGGIRRASAEIGIGQSAVTRRIQKLEDALGVSLFERSQAGTRLTPVGWDFSGQARRILRDLNSAIASARAAGAAKNGRLRIGLIASLSRGVLREVVSLFRQVQPEVDLVFTEASRGDLITLLSHRTIDLVVAAGKPVSADDMLLLAEEQVFVAVADNHPLAEKRNVEWADIEKLPFIVCAEEPGPEIRDYIVRRVTGLGRQAAVQEHRVQREGLMNLVGLGVGVTAVCDHWRGVRYPNVTFIPIAENGFGQTIPFSLRWRPDNDNPALRRFLSLAREVSKAGATSSGLS